MSRWTALNRRSSSHSLAIFFYSMKKNIETELRELDRMMIDVAKFEAAKAQAEYESATEKVRSIQLRIAETKLQDRLKR